MPGAAPRRGWSARCGGDPGASARTRRRGGGRPGRGANGALCPAAPAAAACTARPRQPVQQRRRESPVTRAEAHLLLTESALQHRQLVAQGEDLHILVPIAHREQTQHGERVRHAQAGQSQQHGRSSCRVGRQPRDGTDSTDRTRHPAHPAHQLRPGRMRLPASAGSHRALARRSRPPRLETPCDRRPARNPARRHAHRRQPARRHPTPAPARRGPADPGPAGTLPPQARRLCADRGYDFDKCCRLLGKRGVKPVIARRGVAHGSGLGKVRWVVERAFA
ncbi:Pyruvate/2-oxoglutarate dehydrogenase complex dihydrolipoamide acyltransferase (E2) component OS=Streptomyces griseomycini OX=66895 GN=FHS37_007269 PE=4 SV=1 [Streptomyces griseomycini]|uniref:Pyruvate/2-oxoglutarate dehydrogenase complex dihydrolipoamide acyltransferase (E2) component n=1 Tax=Streptomyces griseomycini TaxID=66895 RepID=A0A7W7PXK4_9ACTN|nr:pyruvate/2-oxoglutarate dehydrogenase complex dihydrolipoamide acyltransferase (E2) component [Streptomyces griseomycini]